MGIDELWLEASMFATARCTHSGQAKAAFFFTIPTGNHSVQHFSILRSAQEGHAERTLRRPAGLYNHVVAPQKTSIWICEPTDHRCRNRLTLPTQYDFTDHVLCILEFS
jgi:hypothetical protein